MEFPISFFMDFAWNPEALDAEDLPDYYIHWAEKQFGGHFSEEIAEVIRLYSKYSARRTPEMITSETYSIEHYREADRILMEWEELHIKAKEIYKRLPETYRSAFYQLALFPVEASYNLNEMYVAAGKNRYYAERGAPAANYYADKVRELFEKDAELARYFHEELEDGKWNHMMSQTHIGYTYWNHPPVNKMPAVSYVHSQQEAELGFLLEYGEAPPWGWKDVEGDWAFQSRLPVFDPVNDQDYYIDVLNRGTQPLTYYISTDQDWIQLSSTGGTVKFNEKVYVSIDWDEAPDGNANGTIRIDGAGQEHVIEVPVRTDLPDVHGFAENNGVVSIEASEYEQMNNTDEAGWILIPDLGRTGSSLTIEPADVAPKDPGVNAPSVEYLFTVFDTTSIAVETYLSPTLNFKKNEGLKFAVAINDEAPQVINMHEGETVPDWEYPAWWNNSVADHIKVERTEHSVVAPGTHKLKVWMIDPGVVFQKFVIDAGGLKPSYLGPPSGTLRGE
jgi:hypothetical protein